MQTTDSDLESLLIVLLEKYQGAYELVEKLEQAETNSQKSDLSDKVESAFQAIKQIEMEVASLRDQHKSQSKKISAANNRLVGDIVKLVEGLIPKLKSIEDCIRAEKMNLAPKVHDGIRAMQMISAYSQNG